MRSSSSARSECPSCGLPWSELCGDVCVFPYGAAKRRAIVPGRPLRKRSGKRQDPTTTTDPNQPQPHNPTPNTKTKNHQTPRPAKRPVERDPMEQPELIADIRKSGLAARLRSVTSDRHWLPALQFGLLFLVGYAAWKSFWAYFHPGVNLTVDRGDRSLTWLYFTYATATVACGLAVQVSETMKGHKVCVIVLDYLAMTYLFLFNAWFRNSVVFQLLGIASQD